MITFNKPYLTGKEYEYISDAVSSKQLSGNGKYTQLCHQLLKDRYGFKNCLLTTSCTDALEMAAILIDIKEGDEVIMPSYTFVSTANAFVLRGAKIVFADSRKDHPGIDESSLEKLITPKTKAIVPVHYAGVACDMDAIINLAAKHNLFVIEDAAQAIDSYYTNKKGVKKPLGSIGHLATFSFHETKNIISGEGGLLVINDERFAKRAEIIWEKGTNRSAFYRGEVNKYGWMDIGSSFLPSEMIAAFLYAQLEKIDDIQAKRLHIWNFYYQELAKFQQANEQAANLFSLPQQPEYASKNAHLFHITCANLKIRTALLKHLKSKKIMAVFHYLSLHKSPFFENKYEGLELTNSDTYTDCLIRLPLFYELSDDDLKLVIEGIKSFS